MKPESAYKVRRRWGLPALLLLFGSGCHKIPVPGTIGSVAANPEQPVEIDLTYQAPKGPGRTYKIQISSDLQVLCQDLSGRQGALSYKEKIKASDFQNLVDLVDSREFNRLVAEYYANIFDIGATTLTVKWKSHSKEVTSDAASYPPVVKELLDNVRADGLIPSKLASPN